MFSKRRAQETPVPKMLITRSELGLDGKGGYTLGLTIPIGFDESQRLGLLRVEIAGLPGIRLGSIGGDATQTKLSLEGFTRPEEVEQVVMWLRQYIRDGLHSVALGAKEFEKLPSEWEL